MDHDGFNGRGDEVTRRTKAITDVEMRQYELEMRDRKRDEALRNSEAAIKRIRFWVQVALGIVGGVAIGTFTIARWMGDVAHKGEVSELHDSVVAVRAEVGLMKQMMQLQLQQSQEIARTVRAPMVVQPQTLAPPAHPEAPAR